MNEQEKSLTGGTQITTLVRRRPVPLVIALICTLATTASSIFYPYLTQLLIEDISGPFPWNQILTLGTVLLGGSLFSAINVYVLRELGQHLVKELRMSLVNHRLMTPVSMIEKTQAADSANRIMSDTRLIGSFVSDQVASAVGSILTLIFSVIFLVSIDPILAMVLFGCVGLSFLAIMPIASKMAGITKAIQECEAKTLGRIAEVLLNIRLVKASTAEKEESQLFDSAVQELYNENMKEARIYTFLGPIVDTAISVSLVLVLTMGAWRVASGELTMAALVAFILYLFNVVLPVTQLSIFGAEYSKTLGATQRISEILEQPNEEPSSGLRVNSINGTLIIQNLQFTYPDHNQKVLDIQDLTLEPGKTTALVGLSGAGKSSILSLINRLYDSPGILLHGKDIRHYCLEDWRYRCAYVHQNAPVLSGTVYFNLTYGLKDKPSRTDCEKVLVQVKLWELLKDKEGLDTFISEQGGNISGGQRQRLAVARAMLRKPEILLLDEATSALDSQTEKDIQMALAPLMEGSTTLVAAHRLNTVRNAHCIVLLHQGRVTALGRHEELLERSEEYRLLVKEQLLGSEPTMIPESTI
jgi:ATP-binding cassette subfamily B protein AbcA/BmrA